MMAKNTFQAPKKLTARQIDEKDGDIPDTDYSELPPDFNEETQRRLVAEQLYIERMDFFLGFFYREMNDAALKHGLNKSNFAVAHGMHHFNNYSSALDIAKLSRIALA